MRWRNPKVELPINDQKVAILVEPHKERGTLRESIMSVQVVFGWADPHPGICRVDNMDELGFGGVTWTLVEVEPEDYVQGRAIAWMPAEEFALPEWLV